MPTRLRATRGTATVTLLVASLLATGCLGNDDQAAPVTLPWIESTSTTPAVVTTDPTSTEVAASSTSAPSTSAPSTSSTMPAVQGLELSASGLGASRFGADSDAVVDDVTAILGTPSSDSGWVDPILIGAACPGSEVRFVTWGDLQLFFTDESAVASGTRHFAAYHYGPSLAAVPTPYGLTTAEGIGLGSTVQALRATYARGVMAPGDEVLGPRFVITDGLTAFVTETVSAGVVQSFSGGFGCGE